MYNLSVKKEYIGMSLAPAYNSMEGMGSTTADLEGQGPMQGEEEPQARGAFPRAIAP